MVVKFETGKTYTTRSTCDHNCTFGIEVTKRTEKTISYKYNGRERRSKIRVFDGVESVIPDNYSMAPVFRANN